MLFCKNLTGWLSFQSELEFIFGLNYITYAMMSGGAVLQEYACEIYLFNIKCTKQSLHV